MNMNDRCDETSADSLHITLLDEADHRDLAPVDEAEAQALARGGMWGLIAVVGVIGAVGLLRMCHG